jgi:hypothetical protein
MRKFKVVAGHGAHQCRQGNRDVGRSRTLAKTAKVAAIYFGQVSETDKICCAQSDFN